MYDQDYLNLCSSAQLVGLLKFQSAQRDMILTKSQAMPNQSYARRRIEVKRVIIEQLGAELERRRGDS